MKLFERADAPCRGESLIIFHAGLHKTGSTAIQRWLATSSRSQLQPYSYVGNVGPLIRDGVMPQGLVKTIRRRAGGGNQLVSAENLFGPMISAYASAAEAASNLTRSFSDFGFSVVLYVRGHLEWTESAYTQHIMQGAAESPDRFVRRMLASPNFSWRQLIETISEAIGPERLIVRAYRSAAIVQDFADAIGLPSGRLVIPDSVANRSVRASQTALLAQINQCGDAGVARVGRRSLQELRWGCDDEDGPWSVLPEQWQRELLLWSSQDFRALAQMEGSAFRGNVGDVSPKSLSVRPFIGDSEGLADVHRQAVSLLLADSPCW